MKGKSAGWLSFLASTPTPVRFCHFSQPDRYGAGMVEIRGQDHSCYFSLCVVCSPSSCSYRGSYFKNGAEGSLIFWIRLEGAVGQGVVPGVV